MPAFGVNWFKSLKAPVSARVGGRGAAVGSVMLGGIRIVVLGTRCHEPGDWEYEHRAVARKQRNAILRENRNQELGRDVLPRVPADRQVGPTRFTE